MYRTSSVAVQLSEQNSDEEASLRYHRLLSFEVKGGFLDGMRLDFTDGLNCIIGGRGTGKTTVLEFIRYLVCPETDANGKANKNVVDQNLGSGTAILTVEKEHGVRYRIERSYGEAAALFDGKGNPLAGSLDRSRLFKADIYGH